MLDFLQPKKKLGYIFKSTPTVTAFTKAYADDLTLLNPHAVGAQHTQSYKQVASMVKINEKPSQSNVLQLGFKVFDKKIKNEKFVPISDTVYAPFDPGLLIDGQPVQFIVNQGSVKDPLKANHFKFLGRWLNPLVNEDDIKKKINTLLTEDMNLIENSKVNGFMKLWLYQFYCLAHLSWPFMINDLTRSFALELQAEINLKLKKWAGIGRTVDNGLLFHSKQNFGLGLTSLSDHYQRMQLVKCELLQNSHDTTIQQLYKTRETLNSSRSYQGLEGHKNFLNCKC